MSQVVTMIFIGCFLIVAIGFLCSLFTNSRLEKENKAYRRKLHRYEYRESQEQNEKWKKDFEAIMQKI